jgi:glycosyltransferase involved in cell wall biosynthesis
MLTVPGVKYAYIDQTVDHYSLFFVTYDYPSNGGAATNLYAIYKLYRQMGVTACIAFINEQPIPTELQMEFQKDPNIFFFSSSNMNLAGPKEILQKKKFKVLIFKIYKTLSTLEENGLNTSLFKKIIYLCSGLSTYAPPKNMVKDADSYNNKRRMELYPITKSHKVIFNSELTRSLYHNMIADNDNSDINNKKTLVVNTTLLGMNKDDFVFENNNKFEDRDIDLIFVVSDCCRKVKNASLVYQLYKRPEMKELKKWIIGLNADMSLASLPNTNIINHNLTRMEVIKYLKNSKILLLPSHFDSSPNILYEGLLSGCNVIASKNIGNIEIIPNENIVQIEMNAAKDAAKFATLVPDNLKEWKCKEPSLNAEPKKILDDLILLD